VATFTCLRIEVLNAEAGNVLPRTSAGKWRVSFVQSEARWRELQSIRRGDETWADRTLNAAERDAMHAEVRENVAKGRLRDVVGTWGVAQYAVVAGLLTSSAALLYRRRSRVHAAVASAGLLVACACGMMALLRGYYTSLGI
jgi:hypothetical protein